MGRVEVGKGIGFSLCEGEGWGETAYNCNWITIKFFLKELKFKAGSLVLSPTPLAPPLMIQYSRAAMLVTDTD